MNYRHFESNSAIVEKAAHSRGGDRTWKVLRDMGARPACQGFLGALGQISTSLLDLGFLELGDLCSYPGSVNNCLTLT